MKRCPTCDKTFADGMKFCQTDGTVLIDDAPPADPYKTVVGNQSDIAAAIPPVDPFKTIAASSGAFGKDEDDLLQLPRESDAMKTMLVSPDELREELKSSAADDVPKLDLPPSPAYNPSAPLIEPSPPSQPNFSDSSRETKPPNFPGTNQEDATAVMDASSFQENVPPKFDSKPFENDFSQKSPYGNQENKAIPSPFQDSMPPNYQTPYASPFNEPPNQPESPFDQSLPPFGQPAPFNPPMQQTEWTPPPAPVSEWQNQNIGANTPFQPPVAGQGQNQTLPIISLVLGILSVCCYVSPLTGIAALVTGYLGMKNVNSDPEQYGGKTMAIIGMVLGGLFLLIGIIYWIFVLIIGFSGFAPR